MPTRESHIELQFSKAVRARGGLAVKMAPTIAGIPDRLVLLPGGISYLVELKTLTGGLRAIQVHRHAQLKGMGHDVVVLRGETEITNWLDEVTLVPGPATKPPSEPF